MLKRLRIITISAGLLLSVGSISAPTLVSAALFDGAQGQACDALNLTNGAPVAGQGANACGTTNGSRVNRVLGVVLNLLSLVVGIAAVIMIIIAGLKYITSQGDSASITSAKNTLLYAIIGIIVVALAQFIVQYVLAKATVNPPPGQTVNPTPGGNNQQP